MTDPFRGEMTARHILRENLDWAESERLARQAKPAVAERKLGWPSIKAPVSWLLHRHRGPRALARPQMAH